MAMYLNLRILAKEMSLSGTVCFALFLFELQIKMDEQNLSVYLL